jgi:hypothetical protein
MPDIVDIAVSAGSFETLVTAVKAAGLVETLKSPGPFTVLHRMTMPLPNSRRERFKPSCRTFPSYPNFEVSRRLWQVNKADLEKVDSVISVEGSPIRMIPLMF